MKNNVLILLFSFSILFNVEIYAQNSKAKITKLKWKKSYSISGTIFQTSSYCGGARPTQELLDQMAFPKVYEGKKIYIRKGKRNNSNNKILKIITSDKEGNYSIKLTKGVYSIIVEEQVKEIREGDFVTENQKADIVCLKEWWIKPYYLLEVKNKNIHQLNFTFHHRCFVTNDIPCLTFTGPFPP